MTTETKTRVYAVETVGQKNARLVRGASQISARNHVAKELVRVRVATQNDLVHLLGSGVKIEDASADDAQQPLPLVASGNQPPPLPGAGGDV